MSTNIELKARVKDWERQRQRAIALADGAVVEIDQVDTFFAVPAGRLKLRQLAPDRGELIFYQRPDQAGPKRSEYTVTVTDQPGSLCDTLARALGVSGEVRKRRWLFLSGKFGGQTRIHFDEVKGLGQFLELEVMMAPGQPVEDGERVAMEFRAALDIRDEDLIECAYVDLLTAYSGGI